MNESPEDGNESDDNPYALQTTKIEKDTKTKIDKDGFQK